MTPALATLYQGIILEHNARPRGFGPLTAYTHEARAHNPLCGDTVTLRLRLDAGAIDDGGDPHTPASAIDDGGGPHTPASAIDDGGGPHTPASAIDDGGGPHTPASAIDDGGGPHTPASAIAAAAFEGDGCALCRASASLLTVAVTGQDATQALALAAELDALVSPGPDPAPDATHRLGDLIALRGVREVPARRRCATLPWEALREALRPLFSAEAAESEQRVDLAAGARAR